MSVTLSEVKRAAKAHRAPLAGESAGYLVLAIADQVLGAPRLVQASDVQLTEDGALRVLSGHASSEADAELSLRRALDQLLLVASSGSAALTRASRRATPLGLPGLVRELEAALIPVNRAAARRALARVHRETSRALVSGSLPPDEPQEREEHAEAAPVREANPTLAPASGVMPVVPALVVAPAPVPDIAESHLNGVLSALRDELPLPAEWQESDALTIALEVQPVPVVAPTALPAVAPENELEFEVDIELIADDEAEDSGAAPTVMRAVAVKPVVLAPCESSDEAPSELPAEARTRPEPAIIRKSLRAMLPFDLLPAPAVDPALPATPTLGSLAAQLPVLDADQLARAQASDDSEVEFETPDLTVVTSAAMMGMDPDSEATQETEWETPSLARSSASAATQDLGLSLVASRKSDVSELVKSFQISEHASNAQNAPNATTVPDNQGLRRAIKEMADLELTPAPFAALIR